MSAFSSIDPGFSTLQSPSTGGFGRASRTTVQDRRQQRDGMAGIAFETRRAQFAAEGPETPLVRIAAFLVVVSRNNGYEGRDPTLIEETLHCGEVASFLGLDIDVLSLTLVELQSRGLVEAAESGGLRLTSIAELTRLTEAA